MIRPLNGRHLWLFVFVLLGSFALARPVFAQGGMIQGVVKDAKGDPVENAKITMELQANNRKFETKTDKKGEFVQVGLPSGIFTVTAEKDKMSATNPTQVRAGAKATVNFTLSPVSNLSPEAAKKMVDLQKAFTEGIDAQKAANYDAAIAAFTRATEVDPKCAQCFNNIGMSHTSKKDYEKAEAAYKKAIEVDANNADSYNGLANIYNAQRKFDLAAEASAKAVSLAGQAGAGGAGGSAEALFNQGVILWNAGKVAEAKKQFEAAIAADANHAESHYQLAMALVNEGNLKGAGAEFDAYLKLAPNGPNAASAKAIGAQLPK